MAPARVSLLRIDELEAVNGDTGRAVAWDGSVSWGGPFDRVWLASEGERAQGFGYAKPLPPDQVPAFAGVGRTGA